MSNGQEGGKKQKEEEAKARKREQALVFICLWMVVCRIIAGVYRVVGGYARASFRHT